MLEMVVMLSGEQPMPRRDLYRADHRDNGPLLSYLSVDRILTGRPGSNFLGN